MVHYTFEGPQKCVVSNVAQVVKNLPAMWETWVQSLDHKDALEKGMATHSSILPWEIPGQRSLTGYSPWGHKESDMTECKHPFTTEFKGLSKSSPPMQWSHSFGLKSCVTKGQTQLSNWTATTHMASFESTPSHLYKVHMLQATSKSHGVLQCRRQSTSYRWFLKIIWLHILCLYLSVW